MKKVIVCGLRDIEALRAVEYFLDDDYEIVGYCDVLPYTVNPLRGAKIYSVDQLKMLAFDQIVLATFNEEHKTRLVDALKVLDCDEKIVIPNILRPNSPEKFTEDKVRKIDKCHSEYYGVIMGLSHALKGIDKPTLIRKFFDLSWNGQDIYYNLRLFQYALRNDKFLNLKQAWLCFPVYYLDYDQSQSFKQYTSGQIFSSNRLDDWHNAFNVKTEAEVTGGGGKKLYFELSNVWKEVL